MLQDDNTKHSTDSGMTNGEGGIVTGAEHILKRAHEFVIISENNS